MKENKKICSLSEDEQKWHNQIAGSEYLYSVLTGYLLAGYEKSDAVDVLALKQIL